MNRFDLWDTRINDISGEAFQMKIADRILIQRNSFEQFNRRAFASTFHFRCASDIRKINNFISCFIEIVIQVGDAYSIQQSQLMDFHFVGNRIRMIDDPIQILIADDFHLHLSQLQFETPIDCEAAQRIENNNFLMQFADTVYFRIGDQTTELNNFTLMEIVTRECKGVSMPTLVAIISAATIVLIVVVVVLGFVGFRYIEQRRRERQLAVVMPEGKTYRETQIVMQIEHAGLMKTDLWIIFNLNAVINLFSVNSIELNLSEKN